MPKSILVIDTPRSCQECRLLDDPNWYCMGYHEACDLSGIHNRPSWCPLKPMPTKKEVEVNEIEDIMHPSFEDIYTKHIVTIRLATDKLISLGWNACIDELEEDK